MKNSTQVALAIACSISGGILAYSIFFGDGGADGLSNFFTIIIFGILFIVFVIGFIFSLISGSVSKKTKTHEILLPLFMPVAGILVIGGVFSMFEEEYTDSINKNITIEKSVNYTKIFSSSLLQLEFFHVSGQVTGNSNNTPTVAPIIPKVIDSVLIIPENEDAYTNIPDKLFFIKKEEKSTTEQYLTGVINASARQEKKCTLQNVEVSKEFPYLDVEVTKAFVLDPSICSYLDIPIILQKLHPDDDANYRKVYFIDSQKHENSILIIAIYNDALSANAKIEDLKINNVINQNKWYNSIKLIE